jgi:hypothetical protein
VEIDDLIGCKVWVRRRGFPDCAGQLSQIVHSVALESIASSVMASTFRVDLESGRSMETTGVNILTIENEAFAKEKAKADPWSISKKAFRKFASHIRRTKLEVPLRRLLRRVSAN